MFLADATVGIARSHAGERLDYLRVDMKQHGKIALLRGSLFQHARIFCRDFKTDIGDEFGIPVAITVEMVGISPMPVAVVKGFTS
mgnify:CR=1 FL=1